MNKESFKRSGGHWAIVAFAFIVSALLAFQMVPSPRLVTNEEGVYDVEWGNVIVTATENSTIGAVASGFLEIFFVNHSATPWTAYDTNDSYLFETWANASTDPDAAGTSYYGYSLANAFSLTLKWGVDMDMVIRYRGNATNAKNATIFNNASCRIKVNASGGGCADLTNGGLGTVLPNVVTYNQTTGTFIWINAYYNIGTLGKGGTYTITNIKIEFNY